MININMKEPVKKEPQPSLEKKPNEKNGVIVSSFIKIFDPNTQQVLVEKRAS
jgi:hypothetical protein